MYRLLASSPILLVLLPLGFVSCSVDPAGGTGMSDQGDSSSPALTVLEQLRIVDLTHGFGEDTIYWPTAEPFVLHKGPEGVTEGGYFYNANAFEAAEHGGTHLDAPYHFSDGRWKVGEIPIQRLVGPGVVIDVTSQSSENPDYLLEVQDLRRFEAENGPISEGQIVLIKTGFGEKWPERKRYLGTEKSGEEGVAELHFPGLHPEAADWLAQRSVKAVGIDTASIDFGQSRTFDSHVRLASHNILILENVANLEELPSNGFQVVALPMKISEGSGAPLRLIAFMP